MLTLEPIHLDRRGGLEHFAPKSTSGHNHNHNHNHNHSDSATPPPPRETSSSSYFHDILSLTRAGAIRRVSHGVREVGGQERLESDQELLMSSQDVRENAARRGERIPGYMRPTLVSSRKAWDARRLQGNSNLLLQEMSSSQLVSRGSTGFYRQPSASAGRTERVSEVFVVRRVERIDKECFPFLIKPIKECMPFPIKPIGYRFDKECSCCAFFIKPIRNGMHSLSNR